MDNPYSVDQKRKSLFSPQEYTGILILIKNMRVSLKQLTQTKME